MSISSALLALNSAKANIATAIANKGGVVNAGDGFSDFAADISTIPSSGGTYQVKTATPSVNEQTIVPDNGYDALSSVTVSGDSDLIPANIKKDVVLFGVTGTLSGDGGSLIQPPNTYRVRYFDYDGTLIKIDYVSPGSASTPPANPDRTADGLTFYGWNWEASDLANIQYPVDVGALYTTTDGKTHIHFSLPASLTTQKTITLYFLKTDTQVMTIEWGDGTANTTTSVSGNSNVTHTYSTYGEYLIKISCPSEYRLGNGSAATMLLKSPHMKFVKKVFMSANSVLYSYAFSSCNSLLHFVFNPTISSIPANTFIGCIAGTRVVLPKTILDLVALALTSVGFVFVFSPTLKTIPSTAIAGNNQTCYADEIIYPPALTSLSPENYRYYPKYILTSPTPPTLSAALYGNTFFDMRIYVPDASVSAYKAATNWVANAGSIYPM